MPLKRLLLLFLPGLLPLLVYVAASELWGDLVGLWVGVGLGAAEFLWFLVTQKRVDGFVLVDTGLLVAMGLISVALADDVFFRLKPVFVEVLLVGLLAWSVFGPRNLLLGMVFKGETGDRVQKALAENPAASRALRLQFGALTVLFAAHTILALASALWMSKEAWAFVTGILPYLLVALVFVVQLALRWRRR
jgi:intracellular septation protein A